MIYLIINKAENFCKIGYSSNPDARLKQLQTGNPYSLDLITSIQGDISLERELHKKFNHLKLQGEWFEYTDEIRDYFKVTSTENYITSLKTIEKLSNLKSIVDIKLLISLCSIMDYNSGNINLTKEKKQYLCNILQVKYQSIANSLSSLKKHNFIIGKNNNYTINPTYFWKGDLKTREELLKEGSKFTLNIEFEN
jgi:hypothetical protein